MISQRWVRLLLIALVPLASLRASAQSLPRLQRAEVPPLLVANAGGGGEVLLELEVGADGRVGGLRVLRATPPYTDTLTSYASGWAFDPAREGEENKPVPSRVLVAGVIRGPAFYQGTSPGALPVNVGAPSSHIPFPENMVVPVFPALAQGQGVVMLELEVASEGQIRAIRPLTRGTGFEEAAIDAARRWSFRPAQPVAGTSDALVIAVFAFPRPVNPF